MRKIFVFLSLLAIVSCQEKPKDYVTFSGKITDKNSDSVVVSNRSYSKTIKVNEDGTFSDTLKVETGMYNFYDGGESSTLYLKNGFDLKMSLDTKMFDETISYTGEGAESNNYLAKKMLFEEDLYPPSLFDYDEVKFESTVTDIQSKLRGFLEKYPNIDAELLAKEQKNADSLVVTMLSYYNKEKERVKARAEKFASYVGKPSPAFENYENYKGGTTSLSDLKGKYVYVDVWATWCGPCKREIPFLKELETEYHDKNIEFVSISVDNGRGYKDRSLELAKEGWKKMIEDKELKGIQLFSDKAWESDFVTGYEINGIPRFILIDPDGNVVNADAPRPSSPDIKSLFNSLNI